MMKKTIMARVIEQTEVEGVDVVVAENKLVIVSK